LQTRTDFLVIGSGLAGLTFALRVADYGKVCVLTKAELSDSNTSWAQGGIAAAVGEADSWKLHEDDTLVAGAGLCDHQAVRHLVQQAPAAIEWLMSLGTRFDTASGGDLALGREGGHGMHRIVHYQDRTGWEVERAMIEAVRNHPNISLYEHSFVTGVIIQDGRCIGADVQTDAGFEHFIARATMLATGGCGKMYQHTTNPRVATADGIALAAMAGAKIENMEFMQFHPTTLFHPQMRSFLITEAVRGAGGTLRNHLGRRFMYDYDDRLELAPRDIVARSIEAEIKKHGTWCVYLDATHLPKEQLIHEFPTIYEKLASIELYMEKDWIPVVPAQHYSCGGVRTDLDGQTTVPGLFAAGEVACTGVHGANRLASNSLLEALVFASAAAKVSPTEPQPESIHNPAKEPKCIPEATAIQIRRALQRTMTQNVGIVRTDAGLKAQIETINDLKHQFEVSPSAPFSAYGMESMNLLIASNYVAQGALDRRKNVGLHFNEDLA
jgi:L-aspartate oxidase